MSLNPVLDTNLSVIFLTDFDVGKAYSVGLKVAKERGVIFQGLMLWTLAPMPLNVTQYLWFVVKETDVNEVLAEVLNHLGIPRAAIRVNVAPSPKPIAEPQPKATGTYT